MKNKVLVKLILPELNESFDVFIPVSEIVWKIKKLILKCIIDLSDCGIDQNSDCVLIDKTTGKIYDNNDIIYNVDIRNGSELIVFLNNNRANLNAKVI